MSLYNVASSIGPSCLNDRGTASALTRDQKVVVGALELQRHVVGDLAAVLAEVLDGVGDRHRLRIGLGADDVSAPEAAPEVPVLLEAAALGLELRSELVPRG